MSKFLELILALLMLIFSPSSGADKTGRGACGPDMEAIRAAIAKSCESSFSSSWGDQSYFDDETRPWGSSRFGSSWGDQSYFDDDTRPWGSSRFGISRDSGCDFYRNFFPCLRSK